MFRLYDYLSSGNGYKVRLTLTALGHAFERIEIDIVKGESRTPGFLAMNPNGRIPLLEIGGDQHLAESNAIIWYLGEDSDLVPDDRLDRARVLQWMFFEQYSHEPNIATSRFWRMHLDIDEAREAALEEKHRAGHAALAVMERHLADRSWFVGDRFTLADIALYAYTHVAPEGGFSLEDYPAVRAWIDRVASRPGHIPITQG